MSLDILFWCFQGKQTPNPEYGDSLSLLPTKKTKKRGK